jgi:hypothetical protein
MMARRYVDPAAFRDGRQAGVAAGLSDKVEYEQGTINGLNAAALATDLRPRQELYAGVGSGPAHFVLSTWEVSYFSIRGVKRNFTLSKMFSYGEIKRT